MKFITNMVCYLLEISIAIFVLLTIFSFIFENDFWSWLSEINTFTLIEKITIVLVIYQLMVFNMLTLWDAVRKDAILSKINIFNFAITHLEFERDFELLKDIKVKLTENESIDYLKKDREEIEELVHIYEKYIQGEVSKEDYAFYLKKKLINLQHSYEFYGLAWRGSFLLRIKK